MNEQLTWRTLTETTLELVSPERFRAEFPALKETLQERVDIAEMGWWYLSIITDRLEYLIGLLAALQLPPGEVPEALREIENTFAAFKPKKAARKLRGEARKAYKGMNRPWGWQVVERVGAMREMFECYVAGEYDPADDPNDVFFQAAELAARDEETSDEYRRLIVRGAATALHRGSDSLWPRWEYELPDVEPPLVGYILSLIDQYDEGGFLPLGPVEEARAKLPEVIAKAQDEIATLRSGVAALMPPPPPKQVTDFIEELILLGDEDLSDEHVRFCELHRQEVLPFLTGLALNDWLADEDSPGEGYGPIHAVELLGELKAVEAVQTLVSVVMFNDPEYIIFSVAIKALSKLGRPAVDAIMDVLRYSHQTERKVWILEALPMDSLEEADRERLYRLLLSLWEEADWEDGKSLLAYILARIGGEQAIPLLREAVEDEELDWMDYNEVAAALGSLGVKDIPVRPNPFLKSPQERVRDLLNAVRDPDELDDFRRDAPKDIRSPIDVATAFAFSMRERLALALAHAVITGHPEVIKEAFADLEALSFDADVGGYSPVLQRTYGHLVGKVGARFKEEVFGVLVALRRYIAEDYERKQGPDQLLLAARRLPPDDPKVVDLYGQAAARALAGEDLWVAWPEETDPPLSRWLRALYDLYSALKQANQIPLSSDSELHFGLLEFMSDSSLYVGVDERVVKLINLLLEYGEGWRDDKPLPRQVIERFRRNREAVIPALIRLVRHRYYWSKNAPGGGWAPILAAHLLGELKATQATDTLLWVVVVAGPDSVILRAAVLSLIAIGRESLSTVESYFRYGRRVEVKVTLSEVIGHVGYPGSVAFDLLKEAWEEADWSQERRLVALGFGELGDRRAIPLLKAGMEDERADGLDRLYMHWALRRLGVSLPPFKMPPRWKNLNAPEPPNPRFIVSEDDDRPVRVRYNVWGQMLCPDCGRPLVPDSHGVLTHVAESGLPHGTGQTGTKRRRRRRRKKKR